ncbi:UNVERIFIED_CONTAM: hypothetical protein Sangu_2469500 [Sesamum angustifolium]|uniref:Uncharacterized protein n=1 Tax=Sesamum angustifolium TaxID=2727405 RepID=A0AAW2IYR6_9LAMI
MFDLGELKPTTTSLQLANRNVKYFIVILEDVSIRVDKFFTLVDFIILEMEEDTQISMILIRPFLATVGAIIDVRSRKLFLNVGDVKVEFNMSSFTKYPSFSESCCMVNDVDVAVKKMFMSFGLDDNLQRVLI